MTTALMVLNPRAIPYCMDALRALDVPTCWVSYVPEVEAARLIGEQVAATGFDRYVIISDDCEPTQDALDRVLALHDEMPDACVTGYSNFDRYLPFVNLCWNKLRPPPPHMDSYRFLKRVEVDAMFATGVPHIATTFAGLSFTCMSRDLWLQHPLEVSVWGGQMDYVLSWRLAEAGVPIVAAPGAFVLHHKDVFGRYPDTSPEKQLLVGVRDPAVTWTGLPNAMEQEEEMSA